MIRLVADTKGFAAELGATTRDLDTLSSRAMKLGTTMTDVGARMTLGFTLPFVASMGLAVKAASDLEQAVGATESVFGSATREVDRYARNAVNSVGLSERAYRELAAVAGAQLQNLGVSQQDAAKQADELIRIGADLAATFGGTTADAVSALGAAFRGEADPAERFGLRLNVNTANAKAVEMGLAKTTASVDAHARQQAIMALIVEQSAGALGQFSRESGTLAVQQQKARAEIENAGAKIGQVLLPAAAAAMKAFGGLATFVGDLPGPLTAVIVGIGGFVAVAGPLIWITGSIIQNVTTMIETFPRLAGAARTLGLALGALTAVAAIATVAIAISQLTKSSYDLEDVTRRLSRVSDDQLAGLFRQIAAWEAFTSGVSGAAGRLTVFRTIAEQNVGTAQRLIEALDAQGVNTDKYRKILEAEIAAQQQANSDTENGRKIMAEMAMSTEEAAAAVKELKDNFDTLTQSQFNVEQATINMEKAVDNLTGVINAGKLETLEGRQAFLDAKESVASYGSAVYENAMKSGKSMQEAKDLQLAALREFAGSLAPDSPLRQWLDGYINSLNNIPTDITTKVRIEAEQMYRQLQSMGLTGEQAAEMMRQALQFMVPQGATGGIVTRPTLAMIGEAGPEAVIPLNRAPGASPLGAFGGSTTVVVPLVVDGRVLAEVTASELNRPGGPVIKQRAIV
jgi:hypothetical protein